MSTQHFWKSCIMCREFLNDGMLQTAAQPHNLGGIPYTLVCTLVYISMFCGRENIPYNILCEGD